jgi:hypothetical protein
MKNLLLIITVLLPLVIQAEVTIVNFEVKAKADTAQVRWSSVSEIRNAYYVIEKSTDGITFQPIWNIASQPEFVKQTDYFIADVHPFLGRSYYRLSSVDLDGNTRIHGVTALILDEPVQFDMSVESAPFANGLYMRFKGIKDVASPVILKILDLNGKQVTAQSLLDTYEKSQYEVALELQAGAYIIIAVHQNEVAKCKLVVHK